MRRNVFIFNIDREIILIDKTVQFLTGGAFPVSEIDA